MNLYAAEWCITEMANFKIFDVEHGSCALFTADNGSRMLIDCGQNCTTGWSPTRQLRLDGAAKLDLLAITNYDEDHVDALPELIASGISINALWRPKNASPERITELKSADGMGQGIRELVRMASVYTHPISIPINFGTLQREMYFNPAGSFSDENNLSAIIVLRINGVKVVFTGDMERAGFDLILRRPEVREAVKGASVLVAPHHGRECSVHTEFLDLVRPYWTVISDKGYMYDTQETVPTYRSYSRGANFRGGNRHVLTTRRDGTVSFDLRQDGWSAY